jgi:hypothetical protein
MESTIYFDSKFPTIYDIVSSKFSCDVFYEKTFVKGIESLNEGFMEVHINESVRCNYVEIGGIECNSWLAIKSLNCNWPSITNFDQYYTTAIDNDIFHLFICNLNYSPQLLMALSSYSMKWFFSSESGDKNLHKSLFFVVQNPFMNVEMDSIC